MRNVRMGALLVLAALVAGGGLFALESARGVSAQSSDTVVRLTGPVVSVKKGDEHLPFEVSVENVKNIGSFQFELTYDSKILEYESAEKADFLGSTGREVVCNPITEAGAARFTCVTLRPNPLGPDGSGKLATVYLKAVGSGTTAIKLDRVRMNTVSIDAAEIPVAKVEGTSISVAGNGGFNWMIWGPVIGLVVVAVVGAGAFFAMKSRGGSGDPAPAV